MVDAFSKDVVFSVRPEYAAQIVAGRKTAELRRRFPATSVAGALAFIYSSSPVQALIGCAAIRGVKRMPVSSIWRFHAKCACIERSAFEEYFAGADEGFVVLLEKARKFHPALHLTELTVRFGFTPPQSFCYASSAYRSLLGDERP